MKNWSMNFRVSYDIFLFFTSLGNPTMSTSLLARLIEPTSLISEFDQEIENPRKRCKKEPVLSQTFTIPNLNSPLQKLMVMVLFQYLLSDKPLSQPTSSSDSSYDKSVDNSCHWSCVQSRCLFLFSFFLSQEDKGQFVIFSYHNFDSFFVW